MPSVLAWLDHDEAERRRMQEVIELFRERDTVDELGIGSVRDAFSNLLFPGTSVLQSRARYFLFVPWIYLELERRHVSSAEIAARARRDEVRLINALIEGGEGDGSGVIGAVARDRVETAAELRLLERARGPRNPAVSRLDRPIPPLTRRLLPVAPRATEK